MGCDDFRYDLYYMSEFPISKLNRYHRQPEKQLNIFIDVISDHIKKFGLKNPPCVIRRKGEYDVRPGKCRVTAYVRLGHDTIPAFIVDYDRTGPERGWEPLPYDRTYIQRKYFSGDCVVEMSRRFCNVKKNVDVVHRPGVMNQFERELTL